MMCCVLRGCRAQRATGRGLHKRGRPQRGRIRRGARDGGERTRAAHVCVRGSRERGLSGCGSQSVRMLREQRTLVSMRPNTASVVCNRVLSDAAMVPKVSSCPTSWKATAGGKGRAEHGVEGTVCVRGDGVVKRRARRLAMGATPQRLSCRPLTRLDDRGRRVDVHPTTFRRWGKNGRRSNIIFPVCSHRLRPIRTLFLRC
jgi:hypothetical protein